MFRWIPQHAPVPAVVLATIYFHVHILTVGRRHHWVWVRITATVCHVVFALIRLVNVVVWSSSFIISTPLGSSKWSAPELSSAAFRLTLSTALLPDLHIMSESELYSPSSRNWRVRSKKHFVYKWAVGSTRMLRARQKLWCKLYSRACHRCKELW